MGMRGTRGGTPTKPKHTEESIQRALYENHPILTKPAFEMVRFIFYAWESDYLAISKAGYVYECEIKISHSDFLNEAAHKQEKMLILSDGSESPSKRPNYFYYVCPEGIISEAECPKFAGLMYITDSGFFRCIKAAPCLHKAKYDTQADLLRRDMRDKFYYAMWNWIRRYWRNIGKAKDIAPQTAAAYERALDKHAEEIADLKYRISSYTQWHYPKEKLPDGDQEVLCVIHKKYNTYAVLKYYQGEWWQPAPVPAGGWCGYDGEIIAWREIHE